jgi:hypothetical protein
LQIIVKNMDMFPTGDEGEYEIGGEEDAADELTALMCYREVRA